MSGEEICDLFIDVHKDTILDTYPVDLSGLREQVGDAALLVDLSNPQSLVNQLLSLLHQPKLRDHLIEKGRHQLLQYTDEERWEVLESIFRRFSVKLSCWRAY